MQCTGETVVMTRGWRRATAVDVRRIDEQRGKPTWSSSWEFLLFHLLDSLIQPTLA
jgi:hypothetical protein